MPWAECLKADILALTELKGTALLNSLKNFFTKALRPGEALTEVQYAFPGDRQTVRRIRSEKLTYLSEKKLASIANTCRAVEEQKISGVFLEIGCALGGSAILISSVKHRGRPLNIHDVFGMIPPPSDKDPKDVHDRYKTIASGKSSGIGGNQYYGYQNNLFEVVLNNLKSFGIDREAESIQLIKGLVQETLVVGQPIAFAHIDVDWYEPVWFCIEQIFPKLAIHGSMIFDDYHDWGGCKRAVDEYLIQVSGQYEIDDAAGSLRITRTHTGLVQTTVSPAKFEMPAT